MKLSFKQPHLSLTAFPDIEVPPFTVIVGLNGSGKSHLLQAIANGYVSNSVVQIAPNANIHANPSIRLLGQDGRVLDLGQAYNGTQDARDPTTEMMGSFEQIRLDILATQRAALDELANHRLASILQPGEDVWRLGAEQIAHRLGETDVDRIESIFADAEQAIVTPNYNNRRIIRSDQGTELKIQEVARQVAAKLGISPLQVNMTQMKLFAPWGNTDQFSTNLPLLFRKYRNALVQNRLLHFEKADCGAAIAMSEEDFIANIGSPPWEQINETLAAFGLPYEVTIPELFNFDPVTVNLKKVGTDHIVSPQNLSSGEKVLLQFAVSSFHYDEHFMAVSRPQVLLLDEMDASLHPEMVNRWLGAVQCGLVEEQGMHCIITTHSPTTVALAPEESLFEMKNGHSGLTKISKQDALNNLTFGVPTLSINYSGRRQVFAESNTDAAIYEKIYALIKGQIECDRELNFLSTGLKNKSSSESNGGCTIVKKTVNRLTELGNSSIFGIIDWDGEAVSTDRIKVLADGERDGIENVILDPLLIALLLMKDRRPPEGLQDIDSFTGAANLQRFELQRLIDAIQIAVFPDATDLVEVSYLGGAKGNVLRAYLEEDDHALEDALVAKFPALKKWKDRGRGVLMEAVIEHVLSEYTSFCPSALPSVFEAIANAPD